MLSINEIADGLDFTVEVFQSLPSTHDYLANLGTTDPRLVIADFQTAGHGQYGRTWVSPPSVNVLMSLLMPVRAVPNSDFSSSLGAALIDMVRSLKEFKKVTSRLYVKSPNDLMCDERKFGGILVDTYDAPLPHVIVSLGLNVNWLIHDPHITSLSVIAGATFDRTQLIKQAVREITNAVTRSTSHT